MADIASSVMVASMIVGMLTIPAASKTIDSFAPVSADLPNISSSDNVPKQISTESSSDSFSRSVETAFQEFETHITSESAETSVESAGSSLEIEKSPEETVWKLESSKGKLVVKKSASKTIEKVETPYGSLTTSRENGGVRESFEGSKREKVESLAEDLRNLMEDKRQQIEKQRTKSQVQQYRNNIEIVSVDGSKDYVEVRNSFSRAISLKGWKLTDEVGEYEFESAEIPSEGTLYIYSDSEEELDIEEEDGAEYVYGSDIAWNAGSDTATLWKNGEKVAEKGY